MNEHERHHENVGAYLLGALPELEAQVFERHVMSCDACRDEVAALRPGAHALLRAVPQYEAPPRLKDSLMSVVREEARAREPARARRRPLLPALPSLRPLMAGAAAALAAIALVTALQTGDDGRTLSASVDNQRAPGGSATLEIPEGEDVAVLNVRGLRETPGGEVYVVWAQRGDRPVFESSFDVRPDGSGKAAVEDLEGVDRVMVTRERSPDVAAPTDQPLLTVSL